MASAPTSANENSVDRVPPARPKYLLTDDQFVAMREEFERRKIKDDPFTEGLHGGMMFYEERIAKGELMLVREARLSRSPMDQGWVCSVCNFFYEDFQNEPPDPEQHCRCGAKIIK